MLTIASHDDLAPLVLVQQIRTRHTIGNHLTKQKAWRSEDVSDWVQKVGRVVETISVSDSLVTTVYYRFHRLEY